METSGEKVSFNKLLPQLPAASWGAGKIVFMFPGQGSQFINMGYDLYHSEPVFTDAVDECSGIINPWLKKDIRDVIYPLTLDAGAEARLNNTFYAQSAVSVIGYALAKLCMSRQVHPFLLLGHSIGEFMAAHFAGIFNLRDALFLITSRGRIMSELPRGAMLAVRCNYNDILSLMPFAISLAAINAPDACVVAGTEAEVAGFFKVLSEKGIATRLLKTSHAFHSSLMNPVVPAFEELAREVTMNKPVIPVISTVTGKLLTDDEAVSIEYWSRNIISPVRFSDAVAHMLDYMPDIILEIGPGNVATKLVLRQMPPASILITPSLPHVNTSPEVK